MKRSLTIPRMNAHRLVVAAAALTIAVTGLLASTLAVFNGQSLAQAVHTQVVTDSNTTVTLSGPVNASQDATEQMTLPSQIRQALGGVPVTVLHGVWSDPFGFTGRPSAPRGAGTPEVEAASFDNLTKHAVLVQGSWPAAPAPRTSGPGALVPAAPVPAALPASTARLLHLAPGDTVRFGDLMTNKPVTFMITGLYRPADPTSRYWQLDGLIGSNGVNTAEGFTTYGPLAVQPAAFGPGGPLAVNQGSWLIEPDVARIAADQFSTDAANLSSLDSGLENPSSSMPGLTATTSLPAVLSAAAANLNLARSLLAMSAILLALLAAAALVAVTRLLTGQREGETAMLIARGATRGQLVRMVAAEAAPLCLLSAAAGALAGVPVAGTLGHTSGWTVNPAGPIVAGVVVALGAFAILVLPMLGTVTPGEARARRGRQAAIAGASKAGVDVALIVLAVLACWQLRHYSVVSSGANGSFGVDPVIVLAPALALAAGAVTTLRLLPAAGRAGDRLAARGRRLTGAMASWQISRQPLRQGGAALLIVLATATATLAYAQRDSWIRSGSDQAAFQAGANVRVQVSEPLSAAQVATLATTPGVRTAMPVTYFTNAVGTSDAVAIDATSAAAITQLRADQSALPAAGLFGKISHAPRAGLPLSGTGPVIRFSAQLGPARLGLAPFALTVSVADAYGQVHQLTVTVPDDGRMHTFVTSLTKVAYPLRVTAIEAYYTLPASKPSGPATLTIAGIGTGAGSAGPWSTPLPGRGLATLTMAASSPDIISQELPGGFGMAGKYSLPGTPRLTTSGDAGIITFGTGYGLSANKDNPPTPVAGQLTQTSVPPGYSPVIPGIATKAFLTASGSHVGATVPTTLNGLLVDVHIVAAVSMFPTVTNPAGAIIVNNAAVQNVYAVNGVAPLQPTAWWLATTGQNVPAGLTAALPAGSTIISQRALAAGLLGNSLSAIPQRAMLGIAIAALLLACTGFCVSIAAAVRQRRAESALLAALGVTPRTAAAQLSLEKFVLSLPSAAAGLLIGIVLSSLLVPAITLTSTGTTPVPPVLIEFGWAPTLATAAVLALVPVLTAALITTRRPDPAAGLRTAESA
jgi:ABC-type antimicrobial peptide transport system permease subunit